MRFGKQHPGVGATCDRRDFLRVSAAGLGMLLAGRGTLVRAAEDDPYGGFKMGLQSYTLRSFPVKTALEHTAKLGLHYWEAYPGHIPLGTLPEHIRQQQALLDEAKVTLLGYGVVGFDSNENKAREIFDFAQAMQLKSISADPTKEPATFDLLDRLVAEYNIPIAIHNHGPGARYDKISDVAEMVKDRHPLIGACVDCGHYLRSDEDPVAAIERFGPRVFGVHLKDVKTVVNGDRRSKIFTILGEGDLNILGCLQALRQRDYQNCLSLEYEENAQNPLSDVEVCLQAVRDAVQKLKG